MLQQVANVKIVPKYCGQLSTVPETQAGGNSTADLNRQYRTSAPDGAETRPPVGLGGPTYVVVVNDWLTLKGIPAETFEYRLGNRSALEWVVDQYRVKKNEKGEIVSDPNREDDEKYIVRLVGQVVRVSVETAKIVKELPEKWMAEL